MQGPYAQQQQGQQGQQLKMQQPPHLPQQQSSPPRRKFREFVEKPSPAQQVTAALFVLYHSLSLVSFTFISVNQYIMQFINL
jgi:hypothetical protein